jgi:hypothetical protein
VRIHPEVARLGCSFAIFEEAWRWSRLAVDHIYDLAPAKRTVVGITRQRLVGPLHTYNEVSIGTLRVTILFEPTLHFGNALLP